MTSIVPHGSLAPLAPLAAPGPITHAPAINAAIAAFLASEAT